MTMSTAKTKDPVSRATPIIGQKAHEIQAYGHVVSMPIAPGRTSAARRASRI